jgi:hypothetical protein
MSNVAAKYPIQLQPLKPYYGDDPKKKRAYEKDLRTAESIAKFVNRMMETDYKDREGPVMIGYREIADNLRLEERKVHYYMLQLPSSTDNSVLIQHPKPAT